jgi:hypothetical protein
MSHVRLTHPTRNTLTFKQSVNDEYSREAVANITQELGTDRPPLVHTETRDSRRTIRGTVSAPKQSRDTGAPDWQQALADYVDRLESHVDEYQGIPGYTLVDDQLDISKTATLESVEWSMSPGQLFEIDYTANVVVGRGTFEDADIQRRNPTVDTSMSTMLRLDGYDLEGFNDYQVNREVGLNPKPVYNRESAENNDIIMEDGPRQTIVFEGEWSGDISVRRQRDAEIDSLVATKNPITLETRFPGYNLDGFLINYESTLEDQRGGNSHRYRVEFVEGTRA